MKHKPTIENLETWFAANSSKRKGYAQNCALEFCQLLINAMKEIETITESGNKE